MPRSSDAEPSAAVRGGVHVAAVTPAEAAAHDRAARETHDVPERVLMENAGRAAAAVLHALHPRGRIVVVAGSGNNGGDGAVVARALRTWGRECDLVAVGSRPPELALFHAHPIDVLDAGALDRALARADVVVDAVLGTGLSGPAKGAAAAAIQAINGAGRAVLALDLPSGLEGRTGRVDGPAVHADTTVCFGWPKVGLLFQPARQHCGRLLAVEIGFPPLATATAELITAARAMRCLPPRDPDAHKGRSGRVLILAGREGMAGAAALAGLAARRAGAGLVRLSSCGSNRTILQTLVPEATFVDREKLGDDDGALAHAVVAGPGIGTDAAGRAALEHVLGITGGKPVLLDADGVTLFADRRDDLRRLAASRPVVLTPHPGEMQRLLDRDVAEITADPADAARAAAAAFGCTVLLKGQPSVIASPDMPLLINTSGSSDSATAGMGDQLAGVIGALLAAGVEARDAAATGLFLSSRAADLCALGRSLGPRDVAEALPDAIRDPGLDASPPGLPFVTFDQPARW